MNEPAPKVDFRLSRLHFDFAQRAALQACDYGLRITDYGLRIANE